MTQNKYDSSYDLKSVQMPYLSGRSLRLIVRLLESPLRGVARTQLAEQRRRDLAAQTGFQRRPYLPAHCL